jgi:hypothetical protein
MEMTMKISACYGCGPKRIGLRWSSTMKYFSIIVILSMFLPGICSAAGVVKETLHYDVVVEYIRSLGAVHNIQQTANREFQEDNDKENSGIAKMMSAIRSSTRMKLELNTSISALKRMKLKPPFETLLPNTMQFYKQKIDLHDEVIRIAKMFIDQTPKPGVDYSKMVARMPEITASLEYIDESIFQSMVLVFALLIDEKPDAEGHMSHLNITASEKQKLLSDINTLFGDSLDKANKNWTASSAALLKAYLQKDYKCKDEWQ